MLKTLDLLSLGETGLIKSITAEGKITTNDKEAFLSTRDFLPQNYQDVVNTYQELQNEMSKTGTNQDNLAYKFGKTFAKIKENIQSAFKSMQIFKDNMDDTGKSEENVDLGVTKRTDEGYDSANGRCDISS